MSETGEQPWQDRQIQQEIREIIVVIEAEVAQSMGRTLGTNELKYLTLECLCRKHELPTTHHPTGGIIPDLKDPKVLEINKLVREYFEQLQ